MYLKKLYCEPNGLFEEIEFIDGINFVYGKKDQDSDSKESLNGIGKSLLLDLIDFCLLSSYNKNNRRLHKANPLMRDYNIVLDFEIEGKIYTVKRNVITPTKIEFGSEGFFETYQLRELQKVLCDLIFANNNYPGKYENKWFRKLISFFIKIERYKSKKFADPIQYIEETSLTELYQYHFYLMGIDNVLIHKNYIVQDSLKKKEAVIKALKQLLEGYGTQNISEANHKIETYKKEIKDLEVVISKFKLQKQYEDVETQANNLTKEIKELSLLNFSDRKKLKAYEESSKLNINVSSIKVSNLYREFDKCLGQNIKKTLDEAIAFRKKLSESRKEFLSDEIKNLKSNIEKREKQISELDSERAKLFTFLSNQNAISDLSEAYLLISKKRESLNELEGKIEVYNDINNQKLGLKIEDSNLSKEIFTFLAEIKSQISDLSKTFLWIHDSIYNGRSDKSNLSIEFKDNTDAKMEILVNVPAVCSEGNTRGRTLLYDLTILLHAIDKDIKCPRFLIHDGIFNGMDKAHFVETCKFLEQVKLNKRFQYIVTLNEEGTIDSKFGDTDQTTMQTILNNAVCVLTPSHKLFGTTYDDS
ncbi:DUF2326 domain-containing protein [Methanosarcina sp.]|uniref:DUF2326 domain-containing protein n=1 Tax=Methanosarcina sp. TaxID=2213 RepID=UPI003C76664D